MAEAPPALTPLAQFTPEHWDKAPREMHKCKIARITHKDDEFVEFVFDDSNAFQRRWADLDMELFNGLHANSEVFVQTFQGTLVTGLFIPEKGWVFKMTGQDLADYAKRVSSMVHKQRQEARGELVGFMAAALEAGLREQADLTGPEADTARFYIDGPVDLSVLANYVIEAMAAAK